MKLEKKMATLIAAILIAMMGVMPALAEYDDEDTVELSVTVTEQYTLGITVAGSGAFGPVVQGESISLSSALIVTVESPGAATVDAELRATATGTPITTGIFYEHMDVIVDLGTPTTVDGFTISATRGITPYDIDATIDVPDDYATGSESAFLVFWITA